MTKKVWLITGASKGIGLAVAKFLLKQGDSVIATSRNEKRLIEKISSETDNFLPLKLDITNKNDAFEARVQKPDWCMIRSVLKQNIKNSSSKYDLLEY